MYPFELIISLTRRLKIDEFRVAFLHGHGSFVNRLKKPACLQKASISLCSFYTDDTNSIYDVVGMMVGEPNHFKALIQGDFEVRITLVSNYKACPALCLSYSMLRFLASLTLQLLLLTGTPLLIPKWSAINNPAQAMPCPGRSTMFSLKQLNRNTPIGAYMRQLKNRALC